jgi:acetone carboxylase alpha subunit
VSGAGAVDRVGDVGEVGGGEFDVRCADPAVDLARIAGGQYLTNHMGLQFDVAKDGELYMISQGAGGGYGDVLERDPHAVVRDVELNRISPTVAREIFAVAYDPDTFILDADATTELRAQARRDRLQRGKPYAEFVKEFVTPEPPKDLLY